ncbi:MAG TPA: hypothetical protein DDY49_13025 [Paenibacillaceae bacterium]|nr:hypothetical protein [Paenibacillaceae bacterium]
MSNNKKGKPCKNPEAPSFIEQLMKSKKLEFITAALLLSGELIVDSVELDRRGGVTVTLLGAFKTKDNKKVQDLTSFLENNKDMTLDEVFTAFKNHLKK